MYLTIISFTAISFGTSKLPSHQRLVPALITKRGLTKTAIKLLYYAAPSPVLLRPVRSGAEVLLTCGFGLDGEQRQPSLPKHQITGQIDDT